MDSNNIVPQNRNDYGFYIVEKRRNSEEGGGKFYTFDIWDEQEKWLFQHLLNSSKIEKVIEYCKGLSWEQMIGKLQDLGLKNNVETTPFPKL